MSRSKQIGTAGERAVCDVLQVNGFPYAERRALHGSTDLGDITGTPGIVWEVKSGVAAATASDALIAMWMDETETERLNAKADFGVLVVKRKGIGAANAARWWAILPLGVLGQLSGLRTPIYASKRPIRLFLTDAIYLLRLNGYGDALAQPPAASEQRAA